jgi:adenylate cyclase
MAETRKIVAILAADVVGFSRMASADEDRTLALLRSLRADVIDPTVASQNGRVFKRTGDGALVEFRSVVEAVRCTVAIQNAMIERDVGASADQRVDFRMGIHLGDVVEEATAVSWATASISRRDWRGSPNPARSAYPRTPIGRSNLGSILRSATSVRRSSRTLASPCEVYSLQVGLPAQAKAAAEKAGAIPDHTGHAGQSLYRRTAVPEHERRSRTGLFR